MTPSIVVTDAIAPDFFALVGEVILEASLQ